MARSRFARWARIACAVGAAPVLHADETELTIARSASNQLVVEVHGTLPFFIEPSVFPGMDGYATGLVGIHSLDFSEPDVGLFALSASSDIQAIFMGADEGMFVHNGLVLMTPGDTMNFGSPPFDYHPIFQIDDEHPFETFAVRFIFRDLTGAHADSDEFTVTFTALPCGSTCHTNFNCDDEVNSNDVTAFLDAWFADLANGTLHADFEHDHEINSNDVSAFLNHWFEDIASGGC